MRRSKSTIAILVSGLAVSVAVLSACSAGQHTATAEKVSAVPGANVNAGPAALRDGVVTFNASGYPAGGDASLVVRLFNNSPFPITLTAVSSPMAKEVRLVNGQPAASPSPSVSVSPSASASPSASGSPSTTGSPSVSESASTSPSPSVAPSPPPAGSTTIKLAIPAFGKLELVPGAGPYLQLTGLTAAMAPGYVVPVTFTFNQTTPAGSQDFTMSDVGLPMAPPLSPEPRSSVDIEPAE